MIRTIQELQVTIKFFSLFLLSNDKSLSHLYHTGMNLLANDTLRGRSPSYLGCSSMKATDTKVSAILCPT